MRMKPPQPTAIVDDRTTNTVHHPAQGECRFLSRFTIVTPPARYLAQEFRTHVSPAIVGGAEFIGQVIALRTERTRLKREQSLLRRETLLIKELRTLPAVDLLRRDR